MKVIVLFLGLFLFIQPIAQAGDGEGDIVADIISLFEKMDANGIEPMLNSSVELEIGESIGIFSKAQSLQILKKFFNEHKGASFSVNHKGSSAGGARYVVGHYTLGKEELRVNIYVKKVGANYLIQEITID